MPSGDLLPQPGPAGGWGGPEKSGRRRVSREIFRLDNGRRLCPAVESVLTSNPFSCGRFRTCKCRRVLPDWVLSAGHRLRGRTGREPTLWSEWIRLPAAGRWNRPSRRLRRKILL